MIVTVTPNPSVDRTLVVPVLLRGEVNRADAGQIDAGGKGVNVSRALAANDVAHPRRAAAGRAGRRSPGRRCSTETGIDFDPVDGHRIDPVEHRRRRAGRHADQDQCRRPPAVGRRGRYASRHGHRTTSTRVTWVVGCGSLPPDTRPDFYATLIERARAKGALVAIDSSGKPFDACLDARPDLVKPNLEELAELVDRPLDTIDEVVAAAARAPAGRAAYGRRVARRPRRRARRRGRPGPGHPAADRAARATSAPATRCSPASWPAAAADPRPCGRGVAYGSAAASLPGTSMPRPDQLDLDGVRLQPATGSWSLTQPVTASDPTRGANVSPTIDDLIEPIWSCSISTPPTPRSPSGPWPTS